MKFDAAVDEFIHDWQSYGRINSPNTERAYREDLTVLSTVVNNRDPRTLGRNDIKKALALQPNPNSQARRRAAYNSFCKWLMQEGIRKDNPVDQTVPPKKRQPQVHRLTLAEINELLAACNNQKERWVFHLGLFGGFRNAEMRHLTGSDFRRTGLIRVMGKGQRERFVPVLEDLQPTWQEIAAIVPDDRWVLPGGRWSDPGRNTTQKNAEKPISSPALGKLVGRVVDRAGLTGRITPHTLRHGFGDHIARYAGMRNAQFLLGHKDIGTTQIYMDKPTLDELTASVAGMSFRLPPTDNPPHPAPDVERPLIGGIRRSADAKAFAAVLVRLRGDLEPVARQLGEGLR